VPSVRMDVRRRERDSSKAARGEILENICQRQQRDESGTVKAPVATENLVLSYSDSTENLVRDDGARQLCYWEAR
jgi:hypothetical protein